MPPPSKYFSLKYNTHSETITKNVRTVPILLTISPRRFQNLKDYSIKGSMHKQKPKVVAGVVVLGLQALRSASHTCQVSSSITTGFQSESASPTLCFLPWSVIWKRLHGSGLQGTVRVKVHKRNANLSALYGRKCHPSSLSPQTQPFNSESRTRILRTVTPSITLLRHNLIQSNWRNNFCSIYRKPVEKSNRTLNHKRKSKQSDMPS